MKIVLGFIGSSQMWCPLEMPEPLPEGWVAIKSGEERPADNSYASEDGKWLAGPSPEQRATFIAQAKAYKSKLISDASDKIETLKDRIEAGQDKAAELKLWKSYRIALDDVDVSVAPDIEWPNQPE
ncbi:TPA: tail fiber assembly protein [Yersinia enterocolitica]|nr:tail fiber assembly protein [Yersinia enterocolitica]HDL6889563.1 tail fiber assembly protein [Yersinia enterocolitica]HDM8446403.1 tail fiber assembly protein [Yersinia enterocolitica]